MTEELLDPDVRLVLDFLNTVDVEEGFDALADKSSWNGWLTAHGFGAGRSGSLARARSVRDSLRAATEGETAGRAAALSGVPLHVRIGPDGTPGLTASDPVGAVLAAAVRLAADGRWSRLKLCQADDCRWGFYDRSRNRNRTWCSMAVCGNRTKTRTFRERHRAER